MKFKSEHYVLLAICLASACYGVSLLTKIKSLMSITLMTTIGVLAAFLVVICVTQYWRYGE